jgi:hypothetical protein
MIEVLGLLLPLLLLLLLPPTVRHDELVHRC